MSPQQKRSRRIVSTTILICTTIFLLLFSVRLTVFANPDPVRAALRLARQSGAYHFSADIVQHTDPVASIRNTGRTSQREDMYMRGNTNLHTQLMEMKFWSQGGSLSTGEGEIEIRVQNNVAQARTTGGEWHDINNFTGIFAPNSDFLVYLNDARNLKNLGMDERQLPAGETVRFTRYTFDVNGMALAQMLRDAMQQHALEQGELPPGVTLKTPRMYEEMHGTGEIWIGTDGLPIRQILNVQFPEENNEQIRSEITVTFSDFASPPQIALWQWRLDSGYLAQLVQQWNAAYGHALLMSFLGLLLVGGFTLLLIVRRRSRALQTALVLVFATVLVTEPLLINLKVAHAATARQQQANEQQQQQDKQQERQAMQQQAMQPTIDPHTNPMIQARDEARVRQTLRIGDNPEDAHITAIDADEWDHVLDSDGDGLTSDDDDGTDSDGDGLTDAQEEILGTSSDPDYGQDTDSDDLTDQEEVEGFTLNGETWYTDPLNSDTNNDGISDGLEWGTDIDGDGIPDVYDRDNDGDGVTDYLDDSPNQTTSGSAVTTLNYQVTGLNSGDKPTTVEFQVRPEEASRIWYAENIFDWPSVDNEGNVQDSDGATFRDEGMMSDNTRADYGDMTLVPMLEIRIQTSDSGGSGVTSQLPYANDVTIELDPIANDEDEHYIYLQQDDSSTLSISAANTDSMPTGWSFALVRSDCDTYTDDETDTGTIDVIGSVSSGGSFSGNLQTLQATDSDSDDVNDRYAIVALAGDSAQACGDVPTLVFENDQMVDYDQMREYNITVREDTNGDFLAYVPLSVVEDTYSGEKVALSGRMYYQPDTTSTWASHQAGLVWGVQILSDQCASTDDTGACESYSTYNSAQLAHVYTDDWYLTGFSVREDFGSDLGIILEDPDYDPNPEDGQLMSLALNLSETFGYRADMTIQTLYDTIDRDNTPTATDEDGTTATNAFQVETSSYSTLDDLLAASATTSELQESVTLAALEEYFSDTAAADSEETYYTLLLARSDIARTVSMESLNSYMTIDSTNGDLDLVVDFSGATTSSYDNTAAVQQATTHTISMGFYEYLGEVVDSVDWSSVDLEDYLTWVEANEPMDSLTEADYAAIDLAYSDANRQTMLELVLMAYASLYYGSSTLVSLGDANLYDAPSTDIIFYSKFANTASYAVTYLVLGTTTGYIKEMATFLYTALPNFHIVLKGLITSAVLVSIAVTALAIADELGAFGDDEVASDAIKISIAAVVSLTILTFLVVLPSISVVKTIAAMSTSVSYTQAATQLGYMKGIKIAMKATVVATVIVVIALIGAFIAAVVSQGIAYGSIAYDSLLAYTIASIIVAIVMAVIALIPIVGQIITGLLLLIDFIVWFITGSTATETVARYIAEAFYSVNVMVEFDDATYGDIDVDLVTDEDGYSDGNSIQISQQISSSVRHVDPDVNFNFAFFAAGFFWGGLFAAIDYAARLSAIKSYYTTDNIRDVSMVYELSSSDEMDEVDKGYHTDDWSVTDNSEGYKYEASKTDDVVGTFGLEAGINFHPTAYLNYAYAIPTVACWSFGAECDVEWSKSAENGGDYGEGLSYDVFPATIDGFLTLGARDGAYSLGWDETFDTIADADGDELLSGSINGSDPDDTTWDTDSDGLSDLFELEMQEEGYYFDPTDSDSDDDMVPDLEESWFGSNPANEDSDGDGLYDCEEVYHELRSSEARDNCDSFVNDRTGGARTSGGWQVLVGGSGSTQYVVATSNPTEPDSDDDGLNDLAEYDLREKGYHPRVENENPLYIRTTLLNSNGDELDDFSLVPGSSVTLQNVLRTSQTGNDSDTTWDNSLQIDMDDGLGGASETWNLNIANDAETTLTYDFTIPTSTSDGSYDILNSMAARSIASASGAWAFSVADEETLTSNLGDETTRAINLAPIAGNTESYLYSTFTSDSDDFGGHGDIYVVASGGSSPRSIEYDSNDLTYLRSGDTGPGVACNRQGTCFVAWSDFDNCRNLNIDAIFVENTTDDPNYGIEPLLHYKKYGWTDYRYLWYTGANDGPLDLMGVWLLDSSYNRIATYPFKYTHGFPIDTEYCEQIDLKVIEIDGCYGPGCDNTDDEFPGERSFGVFADDYNETSLEYAYSTPAWWVIPEDHDKVKTTTGNVTCFLDEPGMTVCFETSLDDEQYYNIGGALTDTSGNLTRARFPLDSSMDRSRNPHDYNPVVATDGDNFLVLWERDYELWDEGFTASKLAVRAFDGSGNTLDYAETISTDIVETSASGTQTMPPSDALKPHRRGYDSAWTGDYYAVVYHSVNALYAGEAIELALVNSNGNQSGVSSVIASSLTTDTYSTPRIATSPNNDRLAVVYEESDTIKLQIGTIDGTSISWENVITVGSGADPDIGYEAQSQSWVVGWTHTEDVSSLAASQAGAVGNAQNNAQSTQPTTTAPLPAANSKQNTLFSLLFFCMLLVSLSLFIRQEVRIRSQRARGTQPVVSVWRKRMTSSALVLFGLLFITACGDVQIPIDLNIPIRYYQVYDLSGNLIASTSLIAQTDTKFALECPEPDTAPVAQFSFDEAAESTTFASDYGDTSGTCSGSACPAAGVVGEREMGGSTVQETWLSFDGSDDYLEVEGVELDNRSFTVAFWARRDRSGDHYVVSQGTRTTNEGLHIGFRGDGTFTCAFWGNDLNTSATDTDNDWHHWACTYNVATGQRVIYRDGAAFATQSSGVLAYTGSGTLNIGRLIQFENNSFAGDLDDVRIYQTSLDSDAVAKIASNALQNVCTAASHTGDSIVYQDIKMSAVDAGESRIENSNTVEVSVDGTAPEVSFTSLDDGDIIRIESGSYKTISGSAYDANSLSGSEEASGVALVEVSTDGGATWETANGRNSWSYNLNLSSGSYTLQARATDETGNVSAETSIGITIDNEEPSVTLTDAASPIRLRQSLQPDLPGWRVALAGEASDSASNVSEMTVAVAGAGQKVATLYQNPAFNQSQTTDWSLDYLLNKTIRQPNGDYTLDVTLEDSLTNSISATLTTLQVDNTSPVAKIVSTGVNNDYTDIITPVTQATTFSGIVTDTGDVAAGIRSLEWALVSPEEVYYLQGIAADRVVDLPFAAGLPYESIPWHPGGMCRSDDTCPTTTSDGQVGNAVSFDGSNDYLVTDEPLNLANESFTVAFWAQRSGTSADMVLSQGTQSASQGLSIGFLDSDTFTCGFWDDEVTVDYTPDGAWHHWSCSYDADTNTRTIYLDGTVVVSDTTSADYQGSGDTTIGGQNLSGQVIAFFAGALDEVLIYDGVLNGDEIDILASGERRLATRPLLDVSGDEVAVNAPVVDMSVSSYRNTCNEDACPQQVLDGMQAEAVAFDGNDDLLTTEAIDLADQSLSIAFWAKRRGKAVEYVLSQGNETGNQGLHIGFRDSNTFTCAFWGNDLNVDYSADNAWHHWGCTYDTDTNSRTIYLDGEAIASDTTSAHYQGSGGINIGAYAMNGATPSGYFAGLLDELVIYDRLLSADEMVAVAGLAQLSDVAALDMGLNLEANHGACTGNACPAVIANGATGDALHFDGNDRVSFPDNDALDLPQRFTLAFWVRPDQTASDWQTLVAKPTGNPALRNYGFAIRGDSMTPVFFGSQPTCDEGFSLDSTTDLTQDGWNHLAATYDGSTITIYVNGVAAGTQSQSSGLCQNDAMLELGGGSQHPFSGDLDQLLIYARPLSDNEIATLASGQQPADIALLDAPLNVADPYVLPARDVSGQSNTAYCAGGTCPQPSSEGRVGDAMLFDGVDDYMAIPTDATLNESFSVAFWARRDSSGSFDYAVSQGTDAPDQGLHIGFRENDTFTCAFWANDLTTTATYTDNEWHHWVCTYDADTQERAVYRDGEQVGSTQTGVSAYTGSGDLNIGRWNIGFAYFDGMLDEVQIYQRALSAIEVAAVYRDADRVWYDARLATPGATRSAWSFTLDDEMEGYYQLDTRATDMLGNRNMSRLDWGTWRGEIDTMEPRISLSAFYDGTYIDYTCTAEDFSIDDSTMQCAEGSSMVITDTETFYAADWWLELSSESGDERLIGMTREVESDATIAEMSVCDYYSRCVTAKTEVVTTSLASLTAELAADQSQLPAGMLPPPPDKRSIVAYYDTPRFGTLYATVEPISITIVLTSTDEAMEFIRLKANQQEFDHFDLIGIYGKPVTATVQSLNWTPPGDDFYHLDIEVDLAGGGGYRTRPITMTVDSTPPDLKIETSKLAGLMEPGRSEDAVLLEGKYRDRSRIRTLEVQVGDNEWERAHIRPDETWEFPIIRVLEIATAEDARTGQRRIIWPDNEEITIKVRATDAAGHVGQTSRKVLVDYAPPQSVAMDIRYTDSSGANVDVQAGDTVRAAPTDLLLSWTASSDGSGIEAYMAGFTSHITPPLHLLTRYNPTVRQHTQKVEELDILYAHVAIRDNYGNHWLQSVGPIYVDSPLTPDLVDSSALDEAETAIASLTQMPETPSADGGGALPPQPLDGYDGWRESGCSDAGTSVARARRTRAGHPHAQQQDFYATWSEKGLRMTWEGANWQSDGDMFIYFNTRDGGTEEAFNPYPGVEVQDVLFVANETPTTIEEPLPTEQGTIVYLPAVYVADQRNQSATVSSPTSSVSAQGQATTQQTGEEEADEQVSDTTIITRTRYLTPSVDMPFAADYMLWMTDTQHVDVLEWNADTATWQSVAGFADEYVWYESKVYRTNIYLPFSLLKIAKPSTTPLDMLALASESDVLLLWATMPDGNPLSSPQVTSSFLSPDLRYSRYTMPHAYHWDSLGTGVCPSEGQYTGTDLPLTITANPTLAFYNLMGDGLYAFQESVLADDGATDGTFNFRGQQNGIAPGTEVEVTVGYENQGEETMQDVRLEIRAHGVLQLPDGTAGQPYSTQEIRIGDLAPEQSGTVSFRATLADDVAASERAVQLDIALHNKLTTAQGDYPLDVYWTVIAIDREAPVNVAVTGPAVAYVGPGEVQITGTVSDTSAIASLVLEQQAADGTTNTTPCDGEDAVSGDTWTCTIIVGGGDGDAVQVRAQATDIHGYTSEWSDWYTLLVDQTPPTVTMAEQDRLRAVNEEMAPVRITIQDNYAAAGAEVCRTYSNATLEPSCETVTGKQVAPSISLVMDFAAREGQYDGLVEQWLITGFDNVGNRSTVPFTATYLYDTVAPVIEVTTHVQQINLADYQTITDTTTTTLPPVLAGTVQDGSRVDRVVARVVRPSGDMVALTLPFAPGDTTWSLVPPVQQTGTYRIYIRAYDALGNMQETKYYEVEVQ